VQETGGVGRGGGTVERRMNRQSCTGPKRAPQKRTSHKGDDTSSYRAKGAVQIGTRMARVKLACVIKVSDRETRNREEEGRGKDKRPAGVRGIGTAEERRTKKLRKR